MSGNNRTHYKNEKRTYGYKHITKDKMDKVCTLLYKMNDYYGRVFIRNSYMVSTMKGTYKHKITSGQLEIKNFIVPIFKILKQNHEMEFIKYCEFKNRPDGDFIYFYMDKKFAKNIKDKGYYYAYMELICNFDGEFDGNICKEFSEKIRAIS